MKEETLQADIIMTSSTPEQIRERLAGNGKCYVCGEQQGGNAHLGCTSRYGLNPDVQGLLSLLVPPEGASHG